MKLKALTPAKKAHPPGAYVVLSSSTAAEFLGERGVAPLRRLSDTAIFRRVWNAFSFCT